MQGRTLLRVRPIRPPDGERSKYVPHSGTREERRRLKQVRAGTLQGPAVSEHARYAAHGLTTPDALHLVVLR